MEKKEQYAPTFIDGYGRKETLSEIKKRTAKRNRENNKMARDLGYPRGVKQMFEEGAL